MSKDRVGRALRIGLTGPIGCGKSTIAGWLAARGAAIVDADRLARGVLEPGEAALAAVVAEFGPGVLGPDGRLDRAALGRIVFDDPAALRRLEAITSPAVRPRIETALAAAEASGAPVVVLEAIRLVEAGHAGWCDEVWLITCRPDEQWARLLARGMDPADAERRIAAQGDLVGRLASSATRTIDTSAPADQVAADVDRLLADALRARHGSSRPSEPSGGGP